MKKEKKIYVFDATTGEIGVSEEEEKIIMKAIEEGEKEKNKKQTKPKK